MQSFIGFGVVNSRQWRWNHEPYFGLAFLKADWITPLKYYPSPNHPVWDLFEALWDRRDYRHMWE